MAKHKKVFTEEKKKVPFNVFRKGAMSLAIAGVMMATPFMLAGCTDAVDGKDGTIWKAGTNYSEFTDAKVGDFFIDTDDYKLYQKTADSWVVVMNNYGKPAVAPVVTINSEGYWVIDGTVTEHVAVATDGATPFIHTDGYWYIGDTEHPTGIKAQGQAGSAGKSAFKLYQEANPEFTGTLADWFETLKGTPGKDGAVWITGTEITGQESSISAEIADAKVGDLYFNSTTSDVYQCTASNTWKWISNTKGVPGGVGQSGVGIASVEQTYEVDETTGELYSVLTITYTEGEPDVIRTLAPKRVVGLDGITLGGYHTNMQTFAKVASEDDAPQLYLSVRFDDQTEGSILLTDDMFVVDGYQYSIPDFTTIGSYDYKIKYMGKIYRSSINIVNLEDYSSHTITSINLTNSNVSTAFNKNNLVVEINYDMGGGEGSNTTTVTAQLSTVSESYYSYSRNEALTELDMSVADSYEITLKSAFAYDSQYDDDEEPDTLYLSVYDANCNISYIDSVNNIVLELGDANFEDKLKAEKFRADLNESIDEENYIYGNIDDLNYDLTNFDINRVGDQYIPFTYQLEGETGVYSDYIQVSVEADLDGLEALGTYAVDTDQCNPMGNMDMMMFTQAIGENATLYKVEVEEDEFIGVAEIDNAQYSYDLTSAESGVLKLFDPFMNTWSYFKLTAPGMADPAGKIGFYEAEGTPTDYTCQILMMGELFDATVSIYGTEGTCKGKISVYMPGERFGSPTPILMPYSTVDCTLVDSDNDEIIDTIIFAGRTFTITTDNVLVEVTE